LTVTRTGDVAAERYWSGTGVFFRPFMYA
jgi:hypothetical protein